MFGVLGGALVVLIWMYLTGASLLVGAEVNSMLADRWLDSGRVEGAAELGDEVPGIADLAAVEEQAHDG